MKATSSNTNTTRKFIQAAVAGAVTAGYAGISLAPCGLVETPAAAALWQRALPSLGVQRWKVWWALVTAEVTAKPGTGNNHKRTAAAAKLVPK